MLLVQFVSIPKSIVLFQSLIYFWCCGSVVALAAVSKFSKIGLHSKLKKLQERFPIFGVFEGTQSFPQSQRLPDASLPREHRAGVCSKSCKGQGTAL